MARLQWDPEYKAWRDALPFPPPLQAKDVLQLRETYNMALAYMASLHSTPPNVQQTVHEVPSHDGRHISVTRFFTKAHQTAASPQPALVFVHGGGMVCGSVEIYLSVLASLVHNSGVQIFAVHYRTAPETPAPGATEDCYAGLAWLSAHAAQFSVDPARIGIMGDSAGGGLAAATALAARDQELSPPLAKQILIYPMLDDRTITRALPDSQSPEDNAIAWKACLGEDRAGKQGADVSAYAAPARAKDLSDLPRTYLEVGYLDIFCEEAIDYVSRLVKVGVEVEFHLYPGLPHGFEAAISINPTKTAFENRLRAIRSF
ncbi:hypothetical protein GQ53DRAFT_861241 [Thozetella sp. PMI_491]|nr:hypothetical protein GQ53DRAFT_861241 [Thozetella sp. PMI_491]